MLMCFPICLDVLSGKVCCEQVCVFLLNFLNKSQGTAIFVQALVYSHVILIGQPLSVSLQGYVLVLLNLVHLESHLFVFHSFVDGPTWFPLRNRNGNMSTAKFMVMVCFFFLLELFV